MKTIYDFFMLQPLSKLNYSDINPDDSPVSINVTSADAVENFKMDHLSHDARSKTVYESIDDPVPYIQNTAERSKTQYDNGTNITNESLDASKLETEIRLLKQSTDLSKSNKTNCEKWINWLTMSNTNREVIFCNIFKVFKEFMVIAVTTCSCEKSFSKLSIVITKLRSTVLQGRLDNLLTMFIEQELAYNVNLDEVIDTFRKLRPVERRLEL